MFPVRIIRRSRAPISKYLQSTIYQIERECQQLALELGIVIPDDIQEDVDVRSDIEKRVARDIANETEIPEDFVY